MKRIIFLISMVSLLFLSGCDSISTEQFDSLQAELDAIEDFDDTALLAEIAALEAELAAIEDFDDTILLEQIAALLAEIEALEVEVFEGNTSLSLLEERVEDMENSYINYDDQWLIDFVAAYDEYDDQWLIDFVAIYADSSLLSLVDDLKINYHYETVAPEYLEATCPHHGTEDTVTDIDGSTLYCYYINNNISAEKFHVYYDTGELKYELFIGWDTLEGQIAYKSITYFFKSGDLYFIGANNYDAILGVFIDGVYKYYDLNGDSTTYYPFLENDLWEIFVEYYLDE